MHSDHLRRLMIARMAKVAAPTAIAPIQIQDAGPRQAASNLAAYCPPYTPQTASAIAGKSRLPTDLRIRISSLPTSQIVVRFLAP